MSHKREQRECELEGDAGFAFDINTREERREERKIFPNLLFLDLQHKTQQVAGS